jgi:hypothetical protein
VERGGVFGASGWFLPLCTVYDERSIAFSLVYHFFFLFSFFFAGLCIVLFLDGPDGKKEI